MTAPARLWGGELPAQLIAGGLWLLMGALLLGVLHLHGPAAFVLALALGTAQTPLFVAAHEAGHALAAWACGLHLLHVHLGFVEFVRERGRWRTSFRRPGRGLGGFVMAVPTTPHEGPWREAAVTAGGPLANFLLAGVYVGLAHLAGGPPQEGWPESLTWPHPAGVWSAVCILGVMTNVMLGLTALAPSGDPAQRSDGTLIGWLFTSARERELAFGVGSLMTLMQYGTRPRDWPAALVRRHLWEGDLERMHPEAHYLAYLHALDLGDVRGARRRLSLGVGGAARWGADGRAPLWLEAAYMAGVHDGDADAAWSYMRRIPAGALEEHTDRRGLAAAHLAAGDVVRAAAAARAALAALPRSADLGGADMERGLLEDILRRAEAVSAAAESAPAAWG